MQVYADNAATTYPKPKSVIKAANMASVVCGGNPGRSGHRLSQKSGEMIYETRERLSRLFNAEEQNCIFTLNCTEALNILLYQI